MTNREASDQSILVTSRAAPQELSTTQERVDLREVFRVHAPYVWNTLRRLGVLPADLEDVTHDVFVQVQRHLVEYDPARPIKPWLFGFAFRVASQHRRGARRRPEPEGAAVNVIDPGALPDERMAAEQDRRLVVAALGAIDGDRRAVFILYEIDGMPMDEIARSLGIPVNTAYSRLRVARAEFASAVKRLRRGER
jgi:RNA polymerase sigma-70 factor (ECF subfamily)